MKSRLLLAAAIAACLVMLAACDRRDDDSTGTAGTADAAGPDTAAAAGDAGRPLPDTGTAAGDAATGNATADAASAAAGTQADAGMAGERAALGVLNAINAHEIAAGQQALRKGVSGDVADYAQMMIDEHSANRDGTSRFDPDASAVDAQAQKAKGDEELAALDRRQGDAYAKAYIDAMVKGHTEALAALDGRIIPAATRPEVQAHLATTREHVAGHLERARALQAR